MTARLFPKAFTDALSAIASGQPFSIHGGVQLDEFEREALARMVTAKGWKISYFAPDDAWDATPPARSRHGG